MCHIYIRAPAAGKPVDQITEAWSRSFQADCNIATKSIIYGCTSMPKTGDWYDFPGNPTHTILLWQEKSPPMTISLLACCCIVASTKNVVHVDACKKLVC